VPVGSSRPKDTSTVRRGGSKEKVIGDLVARKKIGGERFSDLDSEVPHEGGLCSVGTEGDAVIFFCGKGKKSLNIPCQATLCRQEGVRNWCRGGSTILWIEVSRDGINRGYRGAKDV